MKLARTYTHSATVDWISGLPDDVLIRILSCLSTKEVVQTCILSKRWKRVWAHLPALEFNINQFGADDFIGGCDEALRKSIARFDQFINCVLDNWELTRLDRVLYIHDTKRTNFYKVPMQWLYRVALVIPGLVDISIARVDSLYFPYSVFSCANLQHLKIELHTDKKITVMPASIYLPSLKVFEIRGVEIDDKFAQKLLMGCPSLERLKLSLCNLYLSRISSDMLKELDIVGCRQYMPMQISCPSLFSLFIDSYDGGSGFLLTNLNSLWRAAIRISNVAQYFGEWSVQNLFSELAYSEQLMLLCLHINSPVLKVKLERAILNCITFNYLKKLVIIMHAISFDFNLVVSLLKLCPNVKKLGLELDVD